jgi:Ni2+-binding GTPase involved in maturation of urease and hydrogenase
MNPKLIILGGFLGSGKTTLMLNLAESYNKKGLKTAIITNDQGDLLVDTNTSIEKGFYTKQVSSGCFCCKFSEFIDNINEILNEIKPDIILAEPVGSCTDLVSTLVAPLQNFYSDKIELSGFYVLADAYRIIHSYSKMDLLNPETPEEVLLSHQIREAGVILLSKTDMVNENEKRAAINYLKAINPQCEIISYSILDLNATDGLSERILKSSLSDIILISSELDYDIYAEAEAELGWYNGTWNFHSSTPFSQTDYLLELSDIFNHCDMGNVSHGKIFMITEDSSVKLSFVDGVIRSDSVQTGKDLCENCRIVLNIRAKSHPDMIQRIVESSLEALSAQFKGSSMAYSCKSLVPSPPVPEYRITL